MADYYVVLFSVDNVFLFSLFNTIYSSADAYFDGGYQLISNRVLVGMGN